MADLVLTAKKSKVTKNYKNYKIDQADGVFLPESIYVTLAPMMENGKEDQINRIVINLEEE